MTTPTSDALLVLAAREGDRQAFAALIDRHRPRLLALCRRTLGRQPGAEDAAHEAVLQALLSLDRLERPERFGPWLAGIGLNICRRWLRASSRHVSSWETLGDGQTVSQLQDGDPGPEARAEAMDLADRIRRAVESLPEGQRAAVQLFYGAGHSYAETADLLGIEVGAVKTRLHKGRAGLRRALWQLWKEEHMAAVTETEPIEVRVKDVRKEPDGAGEARYVVVLEEVAGDRPLPIWIGQPEAVAIALLLEKHDTPRPLTVALMGSLVRSLGGTLREVRISRLAEEVFYAAVEVDGPGGAAAVDARPSDAIALALSLGAPIRVEPAVMAAVTAAIRPPGEEQVTATCAAPRAGRYGAQEIVAEARERWTRR